MGIAAHILVLVQIVSVDRQSPLAHLARTRLFSNELSLAWDLQMGLHPESNPFPPMEEESVD